MNNPHGLGFHNSFIHSYMNSYELDILFIQRFFAFSLCRLRKLILCNNFLNGALNTTIHDKISEIQHKYNEMNSHEEANPKKKKKKMLKNCANETANFDKLKNSNQTEATATAVQVLSPLHLSRSPHKNVNWLGKYLSLYFNRSHLICTFIFERFQKRNAHGNWKCLIEYSERTDKIERKRNEKIKMVKEFHIKFVKSNYFIEKNTNFLNFSLQINGIVRGFLWRSTHHCSNDRAEKKKKKQKRKRRGKSKRRQNHLMCTSTPANCSLYIYCLGCWRRSIAPHTRAQP